MRLRPSRPVSTYVVDTLMAESAAGHLTYRGPRGDLYRAEVRGRRRYYAVDRMAEYLDGLLEGRENGPRPGNTTTGELAPMWRLLVDPTPADQRRVHVLAAMQARGWDIQSAADMIGRTRASVRRALRFGPPPVWRGHASTLDILEEALAGELALLYPTPPRRRRTPVLLECSKAPAEPVEIRRARALMLAHISGLVTWRSPVDPDEVRRAHHYDVTSPTGVDRRVPGRLLVPWLQGLADGAGAEVAADALTDTRNSAHHVDEVPHVE